MKNLNDRVKEVLAEAEGVRPGIRAHAERVAVYSVATGQRLGLDASTLIRLRVTAQLQGIGVSDPMLVDLIADDPTCTSIIALCKEFDRRRFGFGRAQMSDSECVSWLASEARIRFDGEHVNALLTVQSVIQPIGT